MRRLLAFALAAAAVAAPAAAQRDLSRVEVRVEKIAPGLAVPGHGPVASKADLVAYRAMLIDIRARVAAGIRAKRSLAQIQAAKPAAHYGMAGGFIKPDQFVAFVHESLTKPKKHRH